MEKNIIMYIFVNSDLKMSAGKVAGQVGHLVQQIIEDIMKMPLNSKTYKKYLEWNNSGSTKIILKATQEQIKDLVKNNNAFYVIDAGRTQIADGSMTVAGFYPDITSKYSNYKLY